MEVVIMNKMSKRAYEHTRFFTEDCGQRIAGTPQVLKASDYILDYYRENGIMTDTHEFEVPVSTIKKSVLQVYRNDAWEDIRHTPAIFSKATPEGGMDLELVYVENGNIASFKTKDVRGKAALICRDVYFEYPDINMYKRLYEYGAAAVIYTTTDGHWDVPFVYANFETMHEEFTIPTFVIHWKTALELLNSGVNIEYQARTFILNAVTGYQNLNDRMFLDQDFTEKDIYTLEQKQRANTISEEIVFKSKPEKRWQWATGVSGFYQWLHTSGPVDFRQEGVKTVIESNVNKIFEGLAGPKMRMTANNSILGVGGSFDTPILNGAVFHQSTFNNLFIKGLSATIGLRLDYEKIKMEYNSISNPLNFDFSLAMGPMNITSKGLEAISSFIGKESTDYVQLLPKFALQYEWEKGNSIYATVSKGYRSGGYNIQMFSDLAQGALKNSMLDALAADPNFSLMAERILGMKDELPEVKATTQYKPEYSWNYEIGSHLTLWEGKLWADLAAFYMDTRDQQISQMAESGLGRVTINAGKSRSYGVEAALRTSLTNELSLNASYGYTYATFTDYVTKQKDSEGNLTDKSYNGKYVPFVPKHTLNIGGEYAITCNPRSIFDRVVFQANYNAAGRIYWTEQNNVSQSFYGTLNWRTNLEIGDAMISFWARNFLNKDYAAFYFETMNKGFMQKGRPMQFGIDLRCRF